MRYVALLRGINVGGNNVIKMSDLRDAFTALKLDDVTTYIASGNVLFSAEATDTTKLTTTIEKALGKRFAFDCRIVLVSARALADVITQAPKAFGKDPDRYRYDVLFVKPPLDPQAALREVPLKPGIDEAHAGAHALYFRRLGAKATQSHLPKLVTRPIYKHLTIRNWNTTTKLAHLIAT